jgi:RNA polymerase sigma-70 factor (ECF subfamily)
MSSSTLMLTVAIPGAARGARREESLERRRVALDRFLASVERRAWRMARIAVRDGDAALDIVQDAMLRLVRHYADAPEAEWPLLFFRILHNRIRDHQRRDAVRRRVLAVFGPTQDEDVPDPLAQAPAPPAAGPEERAAALAATMALETALGALPARQREAFLLRAVEGLDVAATAAVMGCSEGSVKTHYSRAVHRLRVTLREHWT